ncbi:hypothetical protein [uncultured Algibacter sp.]|uniref:hypothetical protein n=1 Tax=uncultured Algibacter sp. TaxID=298659 RepID=UPI002609AF94|nr:hypothetical protein [uncultured Algibacter sp.]
MTLQNKRIFASILFVLVRFVSIAQCSGCPNGNPCAPCCTLPGGCGGGPPPPPPGLPIDNLVIAFLLLGISYGAYKYYQFAKRSS